MGVRTTRACALIVLLLGEARASLGRHHLACQLSCVLTNSHSHEDLLLLQLLLAAASGSSGTFVEIGAYDGIGGSQSLLLERCYGWSGVLVEASPQNFAKLLQNARSPRTRKVHSAVCNETSTLKMLAGGGVVAGAVDDMAPGFLKSWKSAHDDECGDLPCRASVPCKPLPAIMADAGYPRTNFLSLDVEGGEARVLETFDTTPGNFPFDAVLVEQDWNSPQKNERVRTLLRAAGLVQLPQLPKIRESMNDFFALPRLAHVPVAPNASVLAAAERDAPSLLPLVASWNTSRILQKTANGCGRSCNYLKPSTVVARLLPIFPGLAELLRRGPPTCAEQP